MATTMTREIHKASGPERLLTVLLVVGANWATDPANYWTLSLRLMRGTMAYGRTIASYSLAARVLTAHTAVSVYDNPDGFRLDDGDRIMLVATPTGSPVVPTDPVFHIEIQSIVR